MTVRSTRRLSGDASSRRRRAPLSKVLAYENPHVLEKFREHYKLPAREAKSLFRDMLMFLWLSSEKPVLIFNGLILVDEMWHHFILHTEDYERFCLGHFGKMIHHRPTHRDDTPLNATEEQVDAMIKNQISFVYDRLGPDVAKRWYRSYTLRYTSAFIDAHTVPRVERFSH